MALDDADAVKKAWQMVAGYADLAARQARSAADGDVESGKKAAETLMFTQRLASATAGYGAGMSPERILAEVAAVMEKTHRHLDAAYSHVMKETKSALAMTYEQQKTMADSLNAVSAQVRALLAEAAARGGKAK